MPSSLLRAPRTARRPFVSKLSRPALRRPRCICHRQSTPPRWRVSREIAQSSTSAVSVICSRDFAPRSTTSSSRASASGRYLHSAGRYIGADEKCSAAPRPLPHYAARHAIGRIVDDASPLRDCAASMSLVGPVSRFCRSHRLCGEMHHRAPNVLSRMLPRKRTVADAFGRFSHASGRSTRCGMVAEHRSGQPLASAATTTDVGLYGESSSCGHHPICRRPFAPDCSINHTLVAVFFVERQARRCHDIGCRRRYTCHASRAMQVDYSHYSGLYTYTSWYFSTPTRPLVSKSAINGMLVNYISIC